MKKAVLIMLIVLTVILLSSCSKMDRVPEQPKEEKSTSFMIYESYNNGQILIDRDTQVMYWMSVGTYNYGTLTLLVEEDGSPKIWKGY